METIVLSTASDVANASARVTGFLPVESVVFLAVSPIVGAARIDLDITSPAWEIVAEVMSEFRRKGITSLFILAFSEKGEPVDEWLRDATVALHWDYPSTTSAGVFKVTSSEVLNVTTGEREAFIPDPFMVPESPSGTGYLSRDEYAAANGLDPEDGFYVTD